MRSILLQISPCHSMLCFALSAHAGRPCWPKNTRPRGAAHPRWSNPSLVYGLCRSAWWLVCPGKGEDVAAGTLVCPDECMARRRFSSHAGSSAFFRHTEGGTWPLGGCGTLDIFLERSFFEMLRQSGLALATGAVSPSPPQRTRLRGQGALHAAQSRASRIGRCS